MKHSKDLEHTACTSIAAWRCISKISLHNYQGKYMSTSSVHLPQPTRELYTDATRQILMHHIVKYFGEPDMILSEAVSPDICVEIAVIEPTPDQNFYTLVTMGMGAHKMSVPEGAQDQHLERSELVLLLDPDWIIPHKDEKYYWPIRLMKTLARQPIKDPDLLICYGYSWCNNKPFAQDTELCAVTINPLFKAFDSEAQTCHLPDGNDINYLFVWPLYQNEYEYLQEHGRQEFMTAMSYVTPITASDRDNGLSQEAMYSAVVLEDMRWHDYSIENKNLNTPPLASLNHLAIFLRFAIENDLMCEPFIEHASDIVSQVKSGKLTDLRYFVRDSLNGMLDRRTFNQMGLAFNQFYFTEKSNPMYAYDVDSYALNHFGVERYSSAEFNDEAYLFVPFTEEYYQNQKKVLEKRFHDFVNMRTHMNKNAYLLYRYMKRFIDYRAWFVPEMNTDCVITNTLRVGHRQCYRDRYFPIIVELDYAMFKAMQDIVIHTAPSIGYDTELPEVRAYEPTSTARAAAFMLNPAPLNNLTAWSIDDDPGDPLEMNAEVLEHFRKKAIETPPVSFESTIFECIRKLRTKFPEVSAYASPLKNRYIALRKQKTQTKDAFELERFAYLKNVIHNPMDIDLDPHVLMGPALGPADSDNPYDLTSYYQNDDHTFTKNMIAANIPVRHPWNIFVYLPFGSEFGLLPHQTIGMAYHFYIHYGALPAVICRNSIEFCMGKPLDEDKLEQLTMELTVLSGGVSDLNGELLTVKDNVVRSRLIRNKSFTVVFNDPELFK